MRKHFIIYLFQHIITSMYQ